MSSMFLYDSVSCYCICLQEEKFKEVREALQLTQIRWTKRGPPNKRWGLFVVKVIFTCQRCLLWIFYAYFLRVYILMYLCAFRCYEVASLDTLPQCVKACWELLHSEAFFLLLSNFTGLRLHFLCPADDDDDDEEKEKEVKTEEKTEEEATSGGETTASLDRSPTANTNSGKGVCHYSRVCVCVHVFSLLFVL